MDALVLVSVVVATIFLAAYVARLVGIGRSDSSGGGCGEGRESGRPCCSEPPVKGRPPEAEGPCAPGGRDACGCGKTRGDSHSCGGHAADRE